MLRFPLLGVGDDKTARGVETSGTIRFEVGEEVGEDEVEGDGESVWLGEPDAIPALGEGESEGSREGEGEGETKLCGTTAGAGGGEFVLSAEGELEGSGAQPAGVRPSGPYPRGHVQRKLQKSPLSHISKGSSTPLPQ